MRHAGSFPAAAVPAPPPHHPQRHGDDGKLASSKRHVRGSDVACETARRTWGAARMERRTAPGGDLASLANGTPSGGVLRYERPFGTVSAMDGARGASRDGFTAFPKGRS